MESHEAIREAYLDQFRGRAMRCFSDAGACTSLCELEISVAWLSETPHASFHVMKILAYVCPW